MRRRLGRAIAAIVLCGCGAGAGGDADDAGRRPPVHVDAALACDPGDTVACDCAGGGAGVRTCDGREYGRCVCLPGPDGGGGADGTVSEDAGFDGGAGGGADGGGGAGGMPADCEDGETERRPCGLNGHGLETRTCAAGVWGEFADCADPDVCRDGDAEQEPCGVSGTRTRVCAGGQWGMLGACDDPGAECVPGTTETEPCGFNGRGSQAHTCEDGRWGELSPCDDPDECVDDQPHQRVCGVNGRGFEGRVCESGAWSDWSACEDPDECTDMIVEAGTCGLNDRGTRRRQCGRGTWLPWSDCEDTDVCVDGVEEPEDAGCGLNGRGMRVRTCAVGAWGPYGDCADPDECVDGRREARACGLGGRGARQYTCVDGRWDEGGACVGAPPCPDPANAACGPVSAEACNGRDDDGDGEIDEGLLEGEARRDRFTEAVDEAVRRALDHLRREEGGRGHFGGLERDLRADALGVLAFLERRQAAGWGRTLGLAGLEHADRAMLQRVLAHLIESDPALTDPRQQPDPELTGGNLAALAAWITAGGPDDVGGRMGVGRALTNGVSALQRTQGPDGGWGEVRATAAAATGLAAAVRVVPGADGALAGLDAFLASQPSHEGDLETTADLLWLGYLRGQPVDAAAVGGLVALGPPETTRQWRALARAVGAARADGDRRFWRRAPLDTPFPEAREGFYFDLAIALLAGQDPAGRWGDGTPHLEGLLALERAYGGLAPDGANDPVMPACADGIDDDGDGLVDVADPACLFECTLSERPLPACADAFDDDGDGLVDVADRGCASATDDDEGAAACENGADDDADGRVDFPDDPGCTSRRDDDERDPATPPACADGVDNDRDGRTDFGEDPDCVSASFETEGDPRGCPGTADFRALPLGVRNARADTSEAPNAVDAACGGQRGRDVIFGLPIERPARVKLSLLNEETAFDTVLYVRATCDDRFALVCNQDAFVGEPRSAVSFVADRPATYYVVVDARDGGGSFRLDIDVEPLPVACSNGGDDDGDGLADERDPGCTDAGDLDERDPATPAECANGRDDDGDDLADFPLDPGCRGPGDESERDPPRPPPCANGLDDDDDGAVDWPADAGCIGRGADGEFGPPAACGDGRDDDFDGHADFPFDPGCFAPADLDEADGGAPPTCANGLDDDRDGVADFPGDPGCASAVDGSEDDPETPPGCANGRDDDGDGRADWPLDGGCRYAADDDEIGPLRPTACTNGRDDDGDGRVDFPDEPGCADAADDDEQDPGDPPARCADGRDNDLDGAADAADDGCVDAFDDDEGDPEVAPLCGNGRDDDFDGYIDWPGDLGCVARGDTDEEQACTDADAPLLVRDARMRGVTQDGEPDRFVGLCGGLGAPDAVFRYRLGRRADLRVRVDNPGTSYPAFVYVRRECEVPGTELGCGPEVLLRDALPGEYYVFVDGPGAGRVTSRGSAVSMPADPRDFVPRRDDLGPLCWEDGGNDAFDCHGIVELDYGGERFGPIDIREGIRDLDLGDYPIRVASERPHPNVWRLRLMPGEAGDERPVTLRITGNLGSDGTTHAALRDVMLGGLRLRYLRTQDVPPGGEPVGAPVVQMLVAADPADHGRVRYTTVQDEVAVVAEDVRLPVTFYVVPSYADADGVARGLADDLQIRLAPTEDRVYGDFDLTVTEE